MPDNLVWLAVLLTILTILSTLFEIGEKVERLIEWLRKQKREKLRQKPSATILQEDGRHLTVGD